MREAVAFAEGSARIWTGSANARAFLLVSDVSVTFTNGWMNYQTLDGSYHDIYSGQRVDVTVGAAMSYDMTMDRMFRSATAVHMEIYHGTPISVSAGWVIYSGRMDSLAYRGSDGQVMTYSMTYHANLWSGYGSAYP